MERCIIDEHAEAVLRLETAETQALLVLTWTPRLDDQSV